MSYATFDRYHGGSNEDADHEDSSFAILDIQDAAHRRNFLTTNPIAVILVHASWCGPCREIKPRFFQFAKSRAGQCAFAREKYELKLTEVTGVPTIAIYRKGQMYRMIPGGDLAQVQAVLHELQTLQG